MSFILLFDKLTKTVRLGKQTPTACKYLPYVKSYGVDAIEIYERSGRKAQEWQKLLMEQILAIDEEGLYVHSTFGYTLPRRNGKNEVAVIRELWGLMNGEHILHTAHRVTTSHSSWERLYKLAEACKLPISSSYRAAGKEHIEVSGGGKVEFRTRTAKGGLGEGFDLTIHDEAQEYQEDQESSLKYVVSDSKNPQTLMCGTPPTPISSGTVFTKLRQDVLFGTKPNSGWAEWSVEQECDPYDVEKWYLTNPSLGTILTERKIRDEIGGDVIDFNIQRLGLWIKYNLKSEISQNDWDAVKVDKLPKFKGKLFVGIKYGVNGKNVSMAIGVKTEDDKVFIELVNTQPIRMGNQWIIDFLKQADVQDVVVDGASGQGLLANEMTDFKLKKPLLPTVKEVINANATFESMLYSDILRHNDQPQLTQVATQCEKRPIGSNGGFGYKALSSDLDITVLDSVILASWLCAQAKEPRKQRIYY